MKASAAMEEPISSFMEQLIFLMVIVVIATAVLFFFMTLTKRIKRLERDRKQEEYQAIVENMLFKYLFEEHTLLETVNNPLFSEMKENLLFNRVAIKAIISLHDNYSGIYSQKLEEFFVASGLVNYSIAQLEAENWPFIVEGIRDLSTLNHNASYSRIASHITHPHKLVKTEVLLALIKMRGIEEIMKFQKTGLRLNDWVQSSILYTVKKHKIPAPVNLDLMLQSPNETIVLLAVRLINYYKSAEHYGRLSLFFQENLNDKLQREIAQVLRKTEFMS